jgi:hypothetical protein
MKYMNKNESAVLATLGFILGLVGLLICIFNKDIALLLAIGAMVLAVVALVKARRRGTNGKGFAIVAILLSILTIAAYLFLVYLAPQIIENIALSLSQPIQ